MPSIKRLFFESFKSISFNWKCLSSVDIIKVLKTVNWKIALKNCHSMSKTFYQCLFCASYENNSLVVFIERLKN